jgi:hypothetical protein
VLHDSSEAFGGDVAKLKFGREPLTCRGRFLEARAADLRRKRAIGSDLASGAALESLQAWQIHARLTPVELALPNENEGIGEIV